MTTAAKSGRPPHHHQVVGTWWARSPFTALFACSISAIALGAASPSTAQTRAPVSPLDGVWKVTKIATTGPTASTEIVPEESLVILAHGYYSYVTVNASQPRQASPPAKDPRHLTDAEKIDRYEEWGPFKSESGAFEVQGDNFIKHPIVAKSVAPKTAAASEPEPFKIDGDTVVFTSKSPAGVTLTTMTRLR